MDNKRIIVKQVSNSPESGYKATLYIGNGGQGVYGATARDAETKLRKAYDCSGVVAEYPATKIVPVAESGYGMTPKDKQKQASREPFDAFTRAVAKMTAATALICAIAFYVGYATAGAGQ